VRRDLFRATALGVAGVVVGCLIVVFAVSRWTELSAHWLNGTMVLPVLGLLGGMKLAQGDPEGTRRLRNALTPIAGVLGGVGNHLAFVITARTWYADQIALDQQGFLYQVFHPGVLPQFSVDRVAQPWFLFTGIGIVAGACVFWWSSTHELAESRPQGALAD
jgi:hypothetical protein